MNTWGIVTICVGILLIAQLIELVVYLQRRWLNCFLIWMLGCGLSARNPLWQMCFGLAVWRNLVESVEFVEVPDK